MQKNNFEYRTLSAVAKQLNCSRDKIKWIVDRLGIKPFKMPLNETRCSLFFDKEQIKMIVDNFDIVKRSRKKSCA